MKVHNSIGKCAWIANTIIYLAWIGLVTIIVCFTFRSVSISQICVWILRF